ncbi:MAG: hypothetical protein NT157_01845, partial [Candidatus Micrarchaeota archaeon]|nr:hypothetical protein [Candidatus Micrarchaeota archaeon]
MAMETVCSELAISDPLVGFWQAWLGNWMVLCALGILIGFFVISLIYMFSKLIDRPQMTAWCRNEFYQIAMTAIIVVGIAGFVGFTCTVIKPSLFGIAPA